MAEALPDGGTALPPARSAGSTPASPRRTSTAAPTATASSCASPPRSDTIASLDGPFGFVFVDADKENYPAYYEAVLPKLADGGLIAFDNVLWSGRVLDDEDQTADTKAIRALNEQLARDDRVECVMLTVRDGLTLVRRRASR